jgi:hypothetical protein
MATNRITKDKLISYAHENIYSYVDNRSYVKDPRSPSGVRSRKFVYDSDPITKLSDFELYPIVIVEMPVIEYESVNVDGKHKIIEWRQQIIVRTAKDGSSNSKFGVGRTDMGDICDDLHELFNNETRKAELRLLNMYKLNLRQISSESIILNDKRYHESEFELTFMTRMAVSD